MIKKIIFHLYAHLIGLIKIFSFQKKIIEVNIKGKQWIPSFKKHRSFWSISDKYKKAKFDLIFKDDWGKRNGKIIIKKRKK